ncbi:hypothetical protein [Ekhidna sp.]|jgi:hypothetical protein|uniref:hypothetical protein n=1 Tax=Ekhidna sp. TaxID=2608089 RepID=UPI0032EB219A
MRLLKSYGIATVILTALLMSACNSDENPCPGVNLEVEIDSANMTAHVFATGLEDVAFDLFVNGQLIESFDAGELDTTEFDLQFEPGEYKVCINAESESCDQKIEGCVEFVIEDPNKEECIGLAFSSDKQSDYDYKFFAEFDGRDDIEYAWYVNGDMVKEEPLNDDRTNYLEWDFAAGTHTVCIKAENDECGEVEYCQEIVIEQYCPEEVSFEAEEDNPYTYYFYANFDGKDHVAYDWYVNDDLVEHENKDGHETDHKLIWQFNPGTYNICLVLSQEGCDDIEYCEEIVIEGEECKELSYTADLNTETDTYTFTADFDGRDDVTYIWKVYINDDFLGSEVREAGSQDDHQFSWTFEEGVEYEICLIQDGGCTEAQVCNIYSLP